MLTLWYSHQRYDPEQNKRNVVIEGSLKRIISNCHPKVIYTEADTSVYNPNAKSFEALASQWHIELDALRDGPMIMVMHQGSGKIFWATVDSEISKLESEYYRTPVTKCDIQIDYSEIDDFERLDPWGSLRTEPGSPVKKVVKKQVPAETPAKA